MGEVELNVKLLTHTPEPEIITALAAKICYQNTDIKGLQENNSKEALAKSLRMVIKSGHHSVLEHANFTFAIEGVSRALTHQLVRHRIASYSQQSQRYVNAENFNYIVPPKIKSDPKALEKYLAHMESTRALYKELTQICPPEDARFILPNAAETKIIVTMNVRSLYNFFVHRCCLCSQWEIRALADKMLEECVHVAPTIFECAGPKCKFMGVCTEGKRSCGLWKKYNAVLKE